MSFKNVIGWILIPYVKIPKLLYKKWEEKHGKSISIIGSVLTGIILFPIWLGVVGAILGSNDTSQITNTNVKADNSHIVITSTIKPTIKPTVKPTLKPTPTPIPTPIPTINPEIEFFNWIPKQFSTWDGSCYEFVRLLKENMNDPDSFEHVETRYDVGDYKLIVYMKYRGRNGFGGKALGIASAELDYKANTIRILSNN